MLISHVKTPSGGWKYREARTRTTIVMLSYDNLVKAVSQHRKNNGLPEGTVEDDIDMQIAVDHPELVL